MTSIIEYPRSCFARVAQVLAFMVLFGGGAESSEASALSEAVAGMQPGEWKLLETQDIGSALFVDATGVSTPLVFQSEGSWDPGSRKIVFIGGPHNGEQDFFSYDENTNRWRRGPQPSWVCASGTCQQHSYNYHAIDEARGIYYYTDNPNGGFRGYRVGTGEWFNAGIPAPPEEVDVPYIRANFALEYWPGRGMAMFALGGMYVYEEDRGRWVQTKDTTSDEWLTPFCLYNRVTDTIIAGGNDASDSLIELSGSSSGGYNVRTLPRPGVGGITGNETHDMLVADPATGDLILVKGVPGAVRMYSLEPGGQSWRGPVDVTRYFPFESGNYFTANAIVVPVFTYGVLLFISHDANNTGVVWIYRHGTSASLDEEPPSPPEDVVAD